MRLSVLLALIAVASGIKINANADPEPEVAPKKKGPFDKSEAEERIEKLSFGYEKAAILKDQHVHPNKTESAEVTPDRASILMQRNSLLTTKITSKNLMSSRPRLLNPLNLEFILGAE